MTKAELMKYVGKRVCVLFKDGSGVCDYLYYCDEFSAKHGYRKPNYFYIWDVSFKVSHVKRVILRE